MNLTLNPYKVYWSVEVKQNSNIKFEWCHQS